MSSKLGKIRDVVDVAVKERIDIMDLSESKRDRLWSDCVKRARVLVQQYKNIRFEVVELVLKCCVIHHGGRSAPQRYTVQKFAEEIGIPYRTLIEWVRIKTTIYDTLDEDDRKELSYQQLRVLDAEVKARSDEGGKTKPRLLKALKQMKSKTPTTIKMEKYLKHLKTIEFNVTNPRMIKDCDPEVLTEILHICRKVVFELAKYDKKES